MADDYEVIAITDEKTYRDEGPFTDDVTYYYRVRKVQDGVPGEYTNEVSVLYTNVESEKEGGSAAYIVISAQGGGYNETDLFNVLNYGALGDGVKDDTAAINAAINAASSAGGGIVYIPDGSYMINPVYQSSSGLMMKSGVFIMMHTDATLKAIPNSAASYYIVQFPYTCINSGISGGKILGDVGYHTGTSGEWGHGIHISGATNIYISDTDISHCWGDGITVHRGSTRIYSQNINIERVTCNNNRRGGLFICTVRGLRVIDSEFAYNGQPQGTAPRFGIICEPNYPDEDVQGVYFENCTAHHNVGTGINFAMSNIAGPNSYSSTPIDFTFNNVRSWANSWPTWFHYGYSGGDIGSGRMAGYTGWESDRISIKFNRGLSPLSNWTNMLTNGKFTSPFGSPWTITGGTVQSTVNGVVTVQATSSTVSVKQNVGVIKDGNKYFFRAYVRNYQSSASRLTGRLSNGPADGSMTFINTVAYADDIAANGPGYTRWTLLSGVLCPVRAKAGNSDWEILVTGSASGRLVQIKDCLLVDLGAIYGEGNEPNSAECLELFP